MKKNYIKEQFVTYEIALAMKELGFDKECLGYYFVHIKDAPVELKIEINTRTNANFIKAGAKRCCLAPLWQQCIKFLYEKYGTIIYASTYDWSLVHKEDAFLYQEFDGTIYEKYEQAILKAIELCQKS